MLDRQRSGQTFAKAGRRRVDRDQNVAHRIAAHEVRLDAAVVGAQDEVRREPHRHDLEGYRDHVGVEVGEEEAEEVSPELMAGVDTYKNSTADMIEGGIAGTVNLRTHVPFDSPDFVLAMSAEAGYGDLTDEVKPAGSVLISDRWTTDIGEFGLMGNVAYSEVVTQSQGVQLNRFFQVQDVDAYGGMPTMLIDCRTRQGQSGSPVLAYREGGGVPMMGGGTSKIAHSKSLRQDDTSCSSRSRTPRSSSTSRARPASRGIPRSASIRP